ncbi:class II aldolase/adducin family protein [Planctomicrobium piriforme]|uniref:L-fuculose-phosphate aldolase n=1 Tax=Planctomicrobium piriforme TaxID=1576369 RepID=A0A1I3DGV9_9PLAN|nr:class II aldolase/adducin family protein [Planctomicrobium piriforme]SFH85819.1 L-fuculose-phosphate aldolase [Planctomicrobium piriforme]
MYHPLFNNPEIKEWICEVGRRVYTKGFAAANDGNISYRVGENEVLCSPTMICKGFMKHEDICMVDLDGKQLAGTRKRTSEILLHLNIMKHRPDVKAVVHCHPPHATAFAVSREAIPQCVLPEIEVFMGEVPLAPYETPGAQGFADTVTPFLKSSNTIILTNHGTVTFGKTLEEAYWKTEILDAYCRILILSKQLGGITYLNEQKSRELLDLKKKLGFDDPRFHLEDCDLCGNTAFREGYKAANAPEPNVVAFDPPPSFAGYLKPMGSGAPSSNSGFETEALVKAITDEVLAALRSR